MRGRAGLLASRPLRAGISHARLRIRTCRFREACAQGPGDVPESSFQNKSAFLL